MQISVHRCAPHTDCVEGRGPAEQSKTGRGGEQRSWGQQLYGRSLDVPRYCDLFFVGRGLRRA